MLRAWPSIPAALALGAALYALLAAVHPDPRTAEDPWLRAWEGAGIRARFLSSSKHLDRHLLSRKGRHHFDNGDFRGTRLRTYDLEGVRAQVVSFPSNAPLPDEEVFGPRYRWTTCERHGLLLEVQRKFMGMSTKLPSELRKRIIAAFEKAAGQLP